MLQRMLHTVTTGFSMVKHQACTALTTATYMQRNVYTVAQTTF